LLRAAIKDDNPIVFLEHELLYGKSFAVPENYEAIIMPLDKANILKYGDDITLVAFSISVDHALAVAEILQAEENISAEVINLISLRPLDKETILNSVKKTGRIISIEEGWPVCSIGSEICSMVTEEAFDYLDAPPTKICSLDVPMPYSPSLENIVLPDVKQIVQLAKKLCNA
jgi:pyruvate dehydrogenase E1 component beta subunit